MNRSSPPRGWVRSDWSEGTRAGRPTLNEVQPPAPIPIPLSDDDGKTLDWSQPGGSGDLLPVSPEPDSVIRRECLIAAVVQEGMLRKRPSH